MNDRQSPDRTLNDVLRAIADEDARAGAPAAVEARVMAAFRSAAAARRRRMRTRVALLTIAAALAIAAAIPLWRSRPVRKLPLQQTSRREIATAFMPLRYSGVPMNDGHIVRMEVPRASLVSFGLVQDDSIDGSASGTVFADVIVGDDGLARAVRFVRRLEQKEQQR